MPCWDEGSANPSCPSAAPGRDSSPRASLWGRAGAHVGLEWPARALRRPRTPNKRFPPGQVSRTHTEHGADPQANPKKEAEASAGSAASTGSAAGVAASSSSKPSPRKAWRAQGEKFTQVLWAPRGSAPGGFSLCLRTAQLPPSSLRRSTQRPHSSIHNLAVRCPGHFGMGRPRSPCFSETCTFAQGPLDSAARSMNHL